jgi:acetyl-CoA carboxylase carboxyltransferase component
MAVMGSEGAANIIFRNRIRESENSEMERTLATQEYQDQFANPYVTASKGYIEDIIHPADTRKMIVSALSMLENKTDSVPSKKHGNIPL